MTPEGKLKDKCRRGIRVMEAEGLPIMMFSPVGTAYAMPGVSDDIVCVAGMYVAIEYKNGNKPLTKLQEKFAERVDKASGEFILIRDMAGVGYTLDRLRELAAKK